MFFQPSCDKAASCASELIGERTTQQPVVKFAHPAIESVQNMRYGQRFRRMNH